MTGPEHYKIAQQLANSARVALGRFEDGEEDQLTFSNALCAQAQVHATLALAAATALNDADGGMGVKDHDAWRSVTSLSPPPETQP